MAEVAERRRFEDDGEESGHDWLALFRMDLGVSEECGTQHGDGLSAGDEPFLPCEHPPQVTEESMGLQILVNGIPLI